MSALFEAPRTGRAEAFYRKLVELYPASFREAYSEEMLRLFAEKWSRVESAPPGQRLHFGSHLLWDWASTMAHEWSAADRSWECTFGIVAFIASILCCLIGGDYSLVIGAIIFSLYNLVAAVVLLNWAKTSVFRLLIRAAVLIAGAFWIGTRLGSPKGGHLVFFLFWSSANNSWSLVGEIFAFATSLVITAFTYFRFRKSPALKRMVFLPDHQADFKRLIYQSSLYPVTWIWIYHTTGFFFGGVSFALLSIALGTRYYRLWLPPPRTEPRELRTFEP